MKRFSSIVVGLLALAASLCGCANETSWAYNPEPRRAEPVLVDAACVVPPFIDRRVNENANCEAFYLIPLMPLGWQTYHTPEAPSTHLTSSRWNFSPPDDLARAVAQEIDAARVFTECFTDPRPSVAPYVLTGEILSTDYRSKLLSYGLSVEGPLLWLFGLPAGTSTNELRVILTLHRGADGPPIWTHTVAREDSRWHWLYGTERDFRYDELLKAEIPGIVEGLRAAMGKPKPRMESRAPGANSTPRPPF